MLGFLFSMWPRLLHHTFVTLTEIGLGLVIGSVFSMCFTVAMLSNQHIKRLFEVVLVLFQAIPMFILAPLMLLFFGFSPWAVILPTALMISLPLTLGLNKGLSATPSHILSYYRSIGVSNLASFFHIRIPYALPAILSSLRVAFSNAALCAIAAEWAGGQEGLGVFIQMMRRDFELYGVLWGVVLVALISLLFYGGMVCIERVFLRRFVRLLV